MIRFIHEISLEEIEKINEDIIKLKYTATWVLKAKYSTLVCLYFYIPEIKGAVNPSKMAVVLDYIKRVNGKLNQLKDHLIDFFLQEIEDDTIWDNDRNEFLKAIKK